MVNFEEAWLSERVVCVAIQNWGNKQIFVVLLVNYRWFRSLRSLEGRLSSLSAETSFGLSSVLTESDWVGKAFPCRKNFAH